MAWTVTGVSLQIRHLIFHGCQRLKLQGFKRFFIAAA